MRILFLCAVCSLTACAQLTPSQQMSLLNEQSVNDTYEFEVLPVGMQGDPDLEEHVIELPAGKSFYKAYDLRASSGSYVVQLRTYIEKTAQGEGFFYPVIDLLDRNKNTIELMRPQLRFTQLSSKGRYAAVPIQIQREVAFMVIRTEPKLYGQEASYTTEHQGSSWSYSVTPFDKRKAAVYLPLGKVELLTPDEGFNQPFEKMSGPFWQIHFDKGSEVLVSASDFVPDLTLGGGPVFSVGYSWAIPSRPFSSIRTSIGGSYFSVSDSGREHRQQFLSSDIMWVESNHMSSVGLGMTIRGGHEYESGSIHQQYDPTFGPKVALEIRGAMGVSIGAQFSWLTLTDQNGVKTGSNQAGFYLTKLY